MATSQSTRTCIYCGGEALKVRKGEHIVPKAIGGRRTISDFCKGRTICNPCNNGPLSELDEELCHRSPLSVIASQEIDSHIWQVWDVDHRTDNLVSRVNVVPITPMFLTHVGTDLENPCS